MLRPQRAQRKLPLRGINDARTSGQITVLGLISQGTMLVKADLMIVLVVLASNSYCLLVELVVKVEQILGRYVQEMRQASGLSSVLVMNCTIALTPRGGCARRELSCLA